MTPLPDYGVRPPGFRMPDAMRIGRVRLQVADLDRSLAFYQALLGFIVLDRDDTHARLGLPPAAGATGSGPVLIELHAKPGAQPVAPRGRLGLYHFAVLLPDRAALGRLIAHLQARHVYMGMSDHFVSEAIYLTDPDGLGLEVYADRPRDRWRTVESQLHMTLDPLAVDELLAEAGATPWTGMPAGTTVGHVHLYVGAIEPAHDFYHRGLGLDLMLWKLPGALFLSAGGYHHHLGTNTWAAGAPPSGPDDARLLDWEILVPTPADADAAAESLRASGHAAGPHPAGGWNAVDPWGTAVQIVGPS